MMSSTYAALVFMLMMMKLVLLLTAVAACICVATSMMHKQNMQQPAGFVATHLHAVLAVLMHVRIN